MKIACIQLDIKWEDIKNNLSRTKAYIKEARTKGAELICLPELFSTGVTTDSSKFAENLNGQIYNFLSEQAKRNEVYILGSFIECNGNKLPKNTAVVFNPQGLFVGKYNKNHVFTYNNEDKSYSTGNDLLIFKLKDFNICPFICYDLRFPEIFRIAVDKGANVFIILANWPNPRKDHWITLLKARAIENQAYVIGINRVGSSPTLSFFGNSMILSPKGQIIGRLGNKEEILIGEINIDSLNEWRNSFYSLGDRRINYYDSLK